VDKAARETVEVDTPPVAPPLLLPTTLFGDPVMAGVFSKERTVRGWLEVEAALAVQPRGRRQGHRARRGEKGRAPGIVPA
jgi:hypothetical protein